MDSTSLSRSLLSLANILRMGVCGGVFILVFGYSRNPQQPLANLGELISNPILLIAEAMLAGILIYSFHRALPNPWIEVFRHWAISRHTKWPTFIKHWLAFEPAIRTTWRRWLYLAGTKDIHTHITDWGDYIHLQYCVTWAITFGSLFARIFTPSIDTWTFSWALFGGVVVTFVGGLSSDLRKHITEQWLYRVNDKIQHELAQTTPPSPNANRELTIARDTSLLPQDSNARN